MSMDAASVAEARPQEAKKSKKRKQEGVEDRPHKKTKRKSTSIHNGENLHDSVKLSAKKPHKHPPVATISQPSDLGSLAATPEPQGLEPGQCQHNLDIDQVSSQTSLPLLEDRSLSPFYTTRLSLYLTLSPISISPTTALQSLLAEHLAPLLLNYHPLCKGVVLAYSDPVLSSSRPDPANPPSPQSGASQYVLARCADTHGASYVWLTVTFVVFRPDIGDELTGWVNVCSEGLLGIVSYNYFQVSIAKRRIPKEWKWNMPGAPEREGKAKKKGKKVKMRDRSNGAVDVGEDSSQMTLVSQDVSSDPKNPADATPVEDGVGHFISPEKTNINVNSVLKYRVVDMEVVPGNGRDKWSLQIEGTLLDHETEKELIEEERWKVEMLNSKTRQADMRRYGDIVMSGALR